MRLINVFLIVLALSLLTPGCASNSNENATTSFPTDEEVPLDTAVMMAPQETEQIAGVGLKNNGQMPVRFYLMDGEQDGELQVLAPERFGTEFPINGYECDLRIEGQNGTWSVERGRRYVFKFQNGAWELFEV